MVFKIYHNIIIFIKLWQEKNINNHNYLFYFVLYYIGHFIYLKKLSHFILFSNDFLTICYKSIIDFYVLILEYLKILNFMITIKSI